MQKSLQILWELQMLDSQKKKIQVQKAGLSTEIIRNLWREIQEMNAFMGKLKNELSVAKEEGIKLERSLADINVQCEQLEQSLYSGSIKHSKELEQVKKKFETKKTQRAAIEEQVYNIMEVCEGLMKRMNVMEENLKVKKKQHAECQKNVSVKIALYEKNIKDIEEQYIILKQSVDERLFNKFINLSKHKPMPIARLDNGICTGCRMTIPTGHVVKNSQEIVHCDNCGRILILD